MRDFPQKNKSGKCETAAVVRDFFRIFETSSCEHHVVVIVVAVIMVVVMVVVMAVVIVAVAILMVVIVMVVIVVIVIVVIVIVVVIFYKSVTRTLDLQTSFDYNSIIILPSGYLT